MSDVGALSSCWCFLRPSSDIALALALELPTMLVAMLLNDLIPMLLQVVVLPLALMLLFMIGTNLAHTLYEAGSLNDAPTDDQQEPTPMRLRIYEK